MFGNGKMEEMKTSISWYDVSVIHSYSFIAQRMAVSEIGHPLGPTMVCGHPFARWCNIYMKFVFSTAEISPNKRITERASTYLSCPSFWLSIKRKRGSYLFNPLR